MASRHAESMVEAPLLPGSKTVRQAEDTPVVAIREAEEFRTVSLRMLAEILDTSRPSARRWLRQAGIRPIAIGRGRNGAIRYRWKEVRVWLESRERVE